MTSAYVQRKIWEASLTSPPRSAARQEMRGGKKVISADQFLAQMGVTF